MLNEEDEDERIRMLKEGKVKQVQTEIKKDEEPEKEEIQIE